MAIRIEFMELKGNSTIISNSEGQSLRLFKEAQ